ncbi:uncharacterized protein CIMG_13482 [Coccidioides immitis RS]|uniref:Aminoglycoside phosphotransferase domain-containing protein n=1 Tax=Coccidioides immitis (strain RS) TaxID=246410 RepID=A0A0E1RXY2_COCIM|nr:uncharacterized protein CIMG_13482 [Coccidioides immitis RS]EAS34639.2 hypothetical protein CIMG_13482 [Coccidioides immitis RS]TPX22049.1 hypothetical protein DIZ76_016016 [Coccidioides immitis]
MRTDERFDGERDRLLAGFASQLSKSALAICDLVEAKRQQETSGIPDWLIRFLIPGKALFVEEEFRNEAAMMRFLRDNTAIPIPDLFAGGTVEENPTGLGPFLIMRWVEGVAMKELLGHKDESSADEDDEAIRRWEQLNIAYDSRAARDRYTCRHLFKSIVPFFTAVDEINGPFKIFCDGLGPGNMLVDPSTLRFLASPPKWLLKKRIAHWVEDEGLEATLESYVPRFNLFLQALEEQEAERYAGIESISGRNRLSMRMRQSLQGRTVWFNSAIRNGWSLDALVWGVLDNHIYGKRYYDEMGIDEKAEPAEDGKPEYWVKIPLQVTQ